MQQTKLSELSRKARGKLVSPWVDKLGDILQLSSWSLERLPEYLWLALIINSLGRPAGMQRCIRILKRILAWNPELDSAKLSRYLEQSPKAQDIIYDIISSEIEPVTLSPLTIAIDYDYSPSFYKHFYTPTCDYETRLETLNHVTRKYYSPGSNDATDLRFLAIIPQVQSGHIQFLSSLQVTDAVQFYHITPHTEEIMKIYRPAIRSLEGIIDNPGTPSSEWVKHYWDVTAQATECELYSIDYKKGETTMDYKDFIEKTKEAINYLNMQYKKETVSDDAYNVLTGSLIYAFKTFTEVIEHNLANSLLGRQAARIIIEVYIMMKYLILHEPDNPAIWSEYMAYGIGKYKLILMKLREGKGGNIQHVSEKVLDVLVNEPQSEEFTDIDLRYFDDVKIRDKAIAVDEKDLYDVAYDYDSDYSHGLWGAIRESCMLTCDNVFHHFRPVADATLSQELPDVTGDCYRIIINLLLLINERYSFPKWYYEYLGVNHDKI